MTEQSYTAFTPPLLSHPVTKSPLARGRLIAKSDLFKATELSEMEPIERRSETRQNVDHLTNSTFGISSKALSPVKNGIPSLSAITYPKESTRERFFLSFLNFKRSLEALT